MLEEFLSKIEGKTLEFKENTTSLKGILKSVIAFANIPDLVENLGFWRLDFVP